MEQILAYDKYVLEQRRSLLGLKLEIASAQGGSTLYVEEKLSLAKEAIRAYGDPARQRLLFEIIGRPGPGAVRVMDVLDSASGLKLGVVRIPVLRAVFGLRLELLDGVERPVAALRTTSSPLLGMLSALPRRYQMASEGEVIASLSERYRPFGSYRLEIDFTPARLRDHRLGLAAAIVLAVWRKLF
ncbi:MAG TPA: hypothetical protein VJ123_00305 [Anaerolineales bacterium]|nr:hypothetical protein [Anaerolineales bacterium]